MARPRVKTSALELEKKPLGSILNDNVDFVELVTFKDDEPIKIEQVYKGFVICVERLEDVARIVISNNGLYCNEFKSYNTSDDIEREIIKAKRHIDDGCN